jgi:hypothetical protein
MYIGQFDKYSCAPIAIMNALRWAGRDCPYDLEWFQKMCRCGNGAGTYLSDLDEVVKFFGLAEKYHESPPLGIVNIELSRGKAALITYINTRKDKEYGHSMLCIGRTPHHYKVINYSRNTHPVQQMRENSLRYLLRRKHKKQTRSRVYFLERGNG